MIHMCIGITSGTKFLWWHYCKFGVTLGINLIPGYFGIVVGLW